MENHGYITQFQATSDLGVLRLASRISDLKKLGYPIKGEFVAVKNRFGETCRVKRFSLEVTDGSLQS
jgi:hypothetical protein